MQEEGLGLSADTRQPLTSKIAAASRAEVLSAAAELLVDAGLSIPRERVTNALSRRERRLSTNLGSGLAIPHAVISDLDSPRTLDIRLTSPVSWDETGEDVSRAVIILVPPGHENAHLTLVANAVRTDG